jgi:hypothetical protein
VVVDDSTDAVFQHDNVKVDQESDLQAEQSEVRKHLGVIDGMQRFFAFNLDNDSPITTRSARNPHSSFTAS